MANGLNVFVAIGAKLLPSLNASATATERRFGLTARRISLMNAEMKAGFAGVQKHWGNFAQSVSVPAALVTAAAGSAAYGFSKVGNELQAVTNMSDQARKGIEAVARALPGNPAENLSAALDLGRSGFNAEQIRGTLATTIKLARSDPSVDTAAASDIMTNVMQGMRLPQDTYAQAVASANRVANNLGYVAAKSSSDVRLVGESFKYVAPTAARLGIGMETLSGMIMTMANAGIKGSEAGVALRAGMVRLLKPTKDANAILAKYNMHLGDYVHFKDKLTGTSLAKQLAAGGFKADGAALQKILDSNISGGELVQKISDAVASGIGQGASGADLDAIATAVTNAMVSGADKMDFEKFVRDATAKGWNAGDFSRFFDVRQGTRLSTLFGPDMVRNINMVKAALAIKSGQGTFLDRMYAMQMQGAVGPWMRMQQSFGNLFISMAESGVMDNIANAMDRIANGVMWLSKTSPGLLKFGTYLLLATAAAAPLSYFFGGIASGARLVWSIFKVITPIFSALWDSSLGLRLGLVALRTIGLAPLLAVTWPVAAAIAAIGLAVAFIIAKWNGIKAFFSGLAKGFNSVVSPETRANLAMFGQLVMTALNPVVGLFRLLSPLLGAVWSWISKIFSPADAAKWAGWGQAVGSAIGIVVNVVVKLVTWLAKAIAKLGELSAKGASFGGGPFGLAFGLGGGLAGKRAAGGPVGGGRAYLVGEHGPEIYVPGANGSIIANHQLKGGGGGPSVNVQPGAIVIHGATDPHATAREVERALRRYHDTSRRLND